MRPHINITNGSNTPAFSVPLTLVKTPFSVESQISKRRPCVARRNRSPKRATTHQFPRALARNRIPPQDEAFITCPACGSDSPISATLITQKGAIPVLCTQCKHRFTAGVEDALTITGKKLAVGTGADGDVSTPDVIKLFVSGLGPKTDSAALITAFEEFGQVTTANVVYDRVTGRSRGFGFVTMVGRSAAVAAMDVLSGDSTRLGRRLNVREADR